MQNGGGSSSSSSRGKSERCVPDMLESVTEQMTGEGKRSKDRARK